MNVGRTFKIRRLLKNLMGVEMTILKLITAGLAAVSTLGPATAQSGFYLGSSVGASSATSEYAGGGKSADTFGTFGAVIGYRKEAGDLFWAAEIEAAGGIASAMVGSVAGTECSVFADAAYVCSVNNTVRLKGLVGKAMNNGYEMFGSLGVVQMNGTVAIGPTVQAPVTNTGYSVGLGVQRDIRGGKARIELVRDVAPNTSTTFGGLSANYRATSIIFSFLFSPK